MLFSLYFLKFMWYNQRKNIEKANIRHFRPLLADAGKPQQKAHGGLVFLRTN